MSVFRWSFLVVLILSWTWTRGGCEVCQFMDSCILPCRFEPGEDVFIHWRRLPGDLLVHAYYHNDDQLSLQDQRFRNRTSLIKDQISKGNASLKLRGVKVQDQGTFACDTNIISNKYDSYIDVDVEAPVTKVDLQQVDDRITCRSEGIYPQPQLTWSTSPPSSITPPDKPTVQQTEQLLYTISSSVIPSDHGTDLVYSCTVSSGRSRRTATLFQPPKMMTSSSSGTTIHCSAPKTSFTSLVWRFNHTHIILKQTEKDVSYVSEEWRQQVKTSSMSGSLTLQDLKLSQDGIYTCELSNHEETYVSSFFLRIEESQDKFYLTVVAEVVGVVFVVVVLILLYIIRKLKTGQKDRYKPREKKEKIQQEYNSSTEEQEELSHQSIEPSSMDYLEPHPEAKLSAGIPVFLSRNLTSLRIPGRSQASRETKSLRCIPDLFRGFLPFGRAWNTSSE